MVLDYSLHDDSIRPSSNNWSSSIGGRLVDSSYLSKRTRAQSSGKTSIFYSTFEKMLESYVGLLFLIWHWTMIIASRDCLWELVEGQLPGSHSLSVPSNGWVGASLKASCQCPGFPLQINPHHPTLFSLTASINTFGIWSRHRLVDLALAAVLLLSSSSMH